jgi:hypothetical protein
MAVGIDNEVGCHIASFGFQLSQYEKQGNASSLQLIFRLMAFDKLDMILGTCFAYQIFNYGTNSHRRNRNTNGRRNLRLGGALNPKSTVDPPIDEDLPLLSFALERLAEITPQELRLFFAAVSELQVQSVGTYTIDAKRH